MRGLYARHAHLEPASGKRGEERNAMTTAALPHWDMTAVFPSLRSPEFDEAFSAFADEVGNLTALFEEHGVGRKEPSPIDDVIVQTFDALLDRLNGVLAQARV